jgi:histidinol phosphatase-like enzyme (inositol monophosphatase family)
MTALDTLDLTPYRTFIAELAHASGDFIRPLFGSHDVAVELKADETPVTAADRGAEALIRERIRARFPSHGVLGEEMGADRADAELVWVLDPIDGTRSFASACPLFGTLIALLHHGRPVLGCIHQPILRQLLVGDGTTATLNGKTVRMRERPLKDATLLVTDITHVAKHQQAAGWDALVKRTALLRTWGDCYGYLLLATGWADVMCDPIMSPWDVAALVPVIRGAGGVITDWQGDEAVVGSKSIVAAHPSTHAEIIQTLRSSAP